MLEFEYTVYPTEWYINNDLDLQQSSKQDVGVMWIIHLNKYLGGG